MENKSFDIPKLQETQQLLKQYISVYKDNKEALKNPAIRKQYRASTEQLRVVEVLLEKEKLKTVTTDLNFNTLPNLLLNLGYWGFQATPLDWQSDKNTHKIELNTTNALALFPSHDTEGSKTVLNPNGNFLKFITFPSNSNLEFRARPLWRSIGISAPAIMKTAYDNDTKEFKGELKMGVQCNITAEIEALAEDPLLMAESGIEAEIKGQIIHDIDGGFHKENNQVVVYGQSRFDLILKGDAVAHIDLSKKGKAAYHCLSLADMDDLGIEKTQNDITRIVELEFDGLELLQVKMEVVFGANGMSANVLEVLPLEHQKLAAFEKQTSQVFKALDDAWAVYEEWALTYILDSKDIATKTYTYFSRVHKNLRKTDLSAWEKNKETFKNAAKYKQLCKRLAKDCIVQTDIVEELIRYKATGDIRSAKNCLLEAIKDNPLIEKIHRKLFVVYNRKHKEAVLEKSESA